MTSTRKVEIDERAQNCRAGIQNDNGVGERGGRRGAKAVEERTGMRALRYPYRQCLVGNCAQQSDCDQTVNNQERGYHD